MKGYLEIAENDLRYLEAVLPMAQGFCNQIAVQCQQITEKYLKGYVELKCLEADNTDVLRGHNLRKLAARLNECYPELKLNLRDMAYLTDFYFDARYPGDDYIDVSEDEMQECLEIMQETVERLKEFFI